MIGVAPEAKILNIKVLRAVAQAPGSITPPSADTPFNRCGAPFLRSTAALADAGEASRRSCRRRLRAWGVDAAILLRTASCPSILPGADGLLYDFVRVNLLQTFMLG